MVDRAADIMHEVIKYGVAMKRLGELEKEEPSRKRAKKMAKVVGECREALTNIKNFVLDHG